MFRYSGTGVKRKLAVRGGGFGAVGDVGAVLGGYLFRFAGIPAGGGLNESIVVAT